MWTVQLSCRVEKTNVFSTKSFPCFLFIYLFIFTKLSPSNSDPSAIDSGMVNLTVLEGSNITLHCNATGKPTSNITWTKDGSPTVLHRGETYSIVNIQKQAAGDYTCTAWNGVDERTNTTATITVHCKLYYFLLHFWLFWTFWRQLYLWEDREPLGYSNECIVITVHWLFQGMHSDYKLQYAQCIPQFEYKLQDALIFRCIRGAAFIRVFLLFPFKG